MGVNRACCVYTFFFFFRFLSNFIILRALVCSSVFLSVIFFFFILEYINAMARKISSEREGKKYKRYAYIFLYLCRFLSACSARYARRFIKLSRSIYKIYVY